MVFAVFAAMILASVVVATAIIISSSLSGVILDQFERVVKILENLSLQVSKQNINTLLKPLQIAENCPKCKGTGEVVHEEDAPLVKALREAVNPKGRK